MADTSSRSATLSPANYCYLSESQMPLDAIPHKSIGGWSGWDYSVVLYPQHMTNPGGESIMKSGKKVLSKVAEWTNHEFGVSFAAGTIAEEMDRGEIPGEVVEVLEAIERNDNFATE